MKKAKLKLIHVSVESEDGWLIAQGLEAPGLITQARTFDELLSNIREVIDLMEIGDKGTHIELIVPPSVQVKPAAARRLRRAS